MLAAAPLRPGERGYLALLERRLSALEHVAAGRNVSREALGLDPPSRAAARRVLRSREATWHDGDENLVRGWLDGWDRGGTAPAERARLLLDAARRLAGTRPRRETFWFFAWELESLLPGVVDAGHPAD